MTNSKVEKHQSRPRRRPMLYWIVPILAAAIWFILAANAAEAQEVQVPDFIVAQVLGRAPDPAAPRFEAAPQVNLVAHRMKMDFQDQLVAGVSQPKVELEVHFDWDSAEISNESAIEVRAAADVLNQYFPATRFRVAGYSDRSGERQYNQVLSEQRAGAVWRALVEEYGVPAERLERIGFGEDDPAADASEADHRRVELQIVRGVR